MENTKWKEGNLYFCPWKFSKHSKQQNTFYKKKRETVNLINACEGEKNYNIYASQELYSKINKFN